MGLNDEQIKALGEAFDPARIRKREGPGGRELSYLAGHDVIRTANKIFGYGNWGFQIRELIHIGTERYKTRDDKAMVRVAYRCVGVLAVAGAESQSDAGFGDANERYYEAETELTAHELALKEAATDAMKRCLKNYGDQFGLLLYDEDRRKQAEGSANQEEIDAALKEIVERGADENAVRAAIEQQKQRYSGLVPRGWLNRQVERARGQESEPPSDAPYG